MGADMLLYCCEDPSDYAKAWPIIQHRINNRQNKELEDFADDHHWCDAQEIDEELEDLELSEEDLYKLNDLRGMKIREMVKEKLVEAVSELIGNPENGFGPYRRDIACMHLNGVSYMFSGGMSWGDQPSDACEYMNIIDGSGLFDGMGSKDFDYDSLGAP